MFCARSSARLAARGRRVAVVGRPRRGRAGQRSAQFGRERRLEAAQERVDRAVGTVVQQAAKAETRDVREAACEHLGPGLDRGALVLAERLELFLEQTLHAFLSRAPVAPLER